MFLSPAARTHSAACRRVRETAPGIRYEAFKLNNGSYRCSNVAALLQHVTTRPRLLITQTQNYLHHPMIHFNIFLLLFFQSLLRKSALAPAGFSCTPWWGTLNSSCWESKPSRTKRTPNSPSPGPSHIHRKYGPLCEKVSVVTAFILGSSLSGTRCHEQDTGQCKGTFFCLFVFYYIWGFGGVFYVNKSLVSSLVHIIYCVLNVR